MEIHQVKVVIILAQKVPTNFGYTRDPSLNNYLQFWKFIFEINSSERHHSRQTWKREKSQTKLDITNLSAIPQDIPHESITR